MTSSPATDHLAVSLDSPDGTRELVGVLHRSGDHSWFETRPEYWETPGRPVLGQIFEQRGPGWKPDANVRLPRWFSHLLPEGRLRDAIAQAAGVKPEREFALLKRIGGDDLPGALRVAVSDHDGLPPDAVQRQEPEPLALPDGLKFSLAGVQLKFSVTETDRGLTVPAKGSSGDWIVKLPDPRPGFSGVPEAEFAALELARASGIAVIEARLVDVAEIDGLPEWATSDSGTALAVRRYDRRPDDARVHAEEFAQVLDVPTGGAGNFKYGYNLETIAKTAFAFTGLAGLGEVVDRIVLNVLVGNGDAHAKNWSFVYPDGRTPALSPAYDLVPTVVFLPDDDLGLRLGGSKRFADASIESLARLARVAGADELWGTQRARAAVSRVVDAWPVLADILPAGTFDRITAHRDQLVRLR